MNLTVDKNAPGKFDIDKIEYEARRDLKALVDYCETSYFNKVRDVAKTIYDNRAQRRIILLSGPSASGKTTTARLIKGELKGLGVETVSIEMDNFFKPAAEVLPLENGEQDFDSINAVDIGALRIFLDELVEKGSAFMPIFDFHTGTRSAYEKVTATADTIFILEGIHALNPLITADTDNDRFYRIYTTASGEFYRDGEKFLAKTELRLTRRLIRDFNFRGSTFANTLSMWKNVCASEAVYVKIYKPDADFLVYSTLAFEPLLYKQIFGDMLNRQDKSELPPAAEELYTKLKTFGNHSPIVISQNSLIHEFIG